MRRCSFDVVNPGGRRTTVARLGYAPTMKPLAILGSLLFFGPSLARAQSLELDLDDEAVRQAGLDPATVRSELGDDIDAELRVVDQKAFLKGMANAAAISARGMGVDYGLDVKKLVVGGSIGTGAANTGIVFDRGDTALPIGGFSGQLTLMAGVNLGGFVPKDNFLDRIRIFVNGMALQMPSNAPFGGSMHNLGGHVQLQLLKGLDAKVAAWRGIAFTTGYDSTAYELSLEQDLPVSTAVDGVRVGWKASGTYDVHATTGSVPLELSTAFHVLVVGVFAGGAYDIATSSADSDAALDGPISSKGSGGASTSLGSAHLTLSDASDGDPGAFRAFAGAQIRIVIVKVYGQVNLADDQAVGAQFGLRAAW
jgi:hypothetical protein